MAKKPFVTIITPTYNRASILTDAIKSIVDQEGQEQYDREHIIIDDGSTDNTKEIVANRQKKYPKNISYYYQENSGIPGVARNLGLENMNPNSDYTFFLDSDDTYTPKCIAHCLDIMGNDRSIAGSYFLCKNQDGKINYPKASRGTNKKIQTITYKEYLRGEIDTELGITIRSDYFLKEGLRFDQEVISESVLRSRRQKLCSKQNKTIKLTNHIGRIYIRDHDAEKPITMKIEKERFKKNAIGYEKILSNIQEDLQKNNYKKRESELLAKSGLNRRLYGDKAIAQKKAKLAYKKKRHIKYLALYIMTILPNIITKKIYRYLIT